MRPAPGLGDPQGDRFGVGPLGLALEDGQGIGEGRAARGLAVGLNVVSVYRRRYPDFPAPRVEKGQNVVLWLRQDIESWAKGRDRA